MVLESCRCWRGAFGRGNREKTPKKQLRMQHGGVLVVELRFGELPQDCVPTCDVEEQAVHVGVSCVDCYGPRRPGCTNRTCGVLAENPLVDTPLVGAWLGVDVVVVPFTNGSYLAALAFIHRFPIVCGATYLLKGLPKGVKGILGLARIDSALHTRLKYSLKVAHKFAICMPSSTTAKRVMIFGNVPYIFLPSHVDLSKLLMYTPLLVNPPKTLPIYAELEPSIDYFIGVTSIRIDGTPIPLKLVLVIL
ncbi:hypothetical protein NE237_032780 [Protea cynaroides]|uniref:Xylanase inhibitor N-terminal domain-containing protein n=1 Tax=Protea cynaroides TaxID=273540 RepID=A0A9Q0R3E4_9MAGN|nr:hypothetical protein NE237_032780 [Protea cynaroides]